jgi:hypothetical protein
MTDLHSEKRLIAFFDSEVGILNKIEISKQNFFKIVQ